MQSKSKIVLSKHTCCALSCRVARYMESHPARVRESKHAKLTCNTQVVAPTRVRESKYTIRRWCLCRTSRGCANQNNTFFFLAATGIRRTLHGCANRNPTAHIEKAYGSVAPCTGARIEIIRWIFFGRYSPAAPCAGARIETESTAGVVMSHLTQVSESKSYMPGYPDNWKTSHLTRVRESK